MAQTLDIDKRGNIYWHNEQKQLHCEDGPAIEWVNGDKEWFINGNRHREDGPAVEYAEGSKEWWVNGVRHRLDGPAVEYVNVKPQWWINGKFYLKEDFPLIVIMFFLDCDREIASIVLELLKN
jgi:hypothetical protein